MNSITMVRGITVGQAENREGVTGCTVILCDPMAVAGIDVRGGGVSTRQIDSLIASYHVVNFVNAIFLTGGSAFGLDATSGVMRYLEEKGKGFSTSMGPIPIVPTAVIYDLGLGRKEVRPDAEMSYQACIKATAGMVEEGSVGVGCGASVGKLYGISRAMKGGVGTAGIRTGELVIGALVVVNAFGDVVDSENGKVLAGLRDSEKGVTLVNTAKEMEIITPSQVKQCESTVITLVATNANLTRAEASHVARMVSGTLGRSISPVHTQFDGDIVFVLSLGKVTMDINRVGIVGGEVVSEAIKRAVKKADGLGLIPAWKDIS
ncbi:MAG: P1 family peptidase [Pseudomonadota bacterium]